jgi:transposase
MRKPIFVRAISDDERPTLEAGLHSSDAFVLRRCQVILASERRKRAPEIAQDVGCDADSVLDIIHAFNNGGVQALIRKSSRPHRTHPAFAAEQREQLRSLLHKSPSLFGKSTDMWTLDMAAEVSFSQGLTEKQVTGETIRATLAQMGVQWRRVKRWIKSPDPAYTRKKGRVIA